MGQLSTQDAVNAAALICRLALGLFFVISGAHKLFNEERRASLKATFMADGVYTPPLMYLIPLGELAGGVGVGVGLLTPVACVGLAAICLGACLLDGLRRIPSQHPLDLLDYLDDVLYLPEVGFMIMLMVLLFLGPGDYSLDHWLLPKLL